MKLDEPLTRRQVGSIFGPRCSLYRHYDADHKLLYVGISLSVAKRISEHNRSSPWFDKVRVITVQHFACRELAEEAEIAAIYAEKPIFNIAFKKPPKRKPIKKRTLRKDFVRKQIAFANDPNRGDFIFNKMLPRRPDIANKSLSIKDMLT